MEEETTVTEINVTPVRDFVRRHKVKIAVVATSAFWIGVNRLALKQHDEFLKEHDLYDEFYTPEDFEGN